MERNDYHMDDEQKYGLEGVEQSQGYEPLPVAHPVPSSSDDLPTDLPADSSNWLQTDDERRHHLRPAPPEPEVREYRNVQTGESIPENQTVSAEQAAHDVGLAREQERAAREQQSQDDLKFALDQLPPDGQQPQPAPQDQQPAALDEPQPDAPQMTAEEAQRLYEVADKELEAALQNPLLREKIEVEFNHVRQQAHAVAEQARQHYAAAVNNLAQEANLVASALFPELAGLSPEQVQGALRVMKPERVAQVREFANKIQGIANVAQQQAHGQQLANQQQFAAYQEQAAENFKQYAEAEDAKALAGETPESMAQIRKTILTDAKAAGVSEKELYEAYNTVPALRHSFVQGLMADGAKWRASQRSLASHRANPVPKVQRPGVTSDGPRVHEGDLAAAASRFNLPGGNEGTQGLKNAAAWLTARRGRG
jgi:hypothetical protein